MKEWEYNQFYISGFQIRRVWSEGEWWYCISDVITYFTKSKNSIEYVVKLRSRNHTLQTLWSENVRKLLLQTKEGKRVANCCNLYLLSVIVHTIPKKYRWKFRILRLRIESLIV